MSQKNIEQLLQRGAIDEAIVMCKSVLQVTPNNALVIGYLGMCYFRKQEFSSALEHFRRATILDPKFVEAGLKMAQCLDRLRRYEEAYEVADEWLHKAPGHPLLRGLVEQLKPYSTGGCKQGWERTAHLNRTVHITSEG